MPVNNQHPESNDYDRTPPIKANDKSFQRWANGPPKGGDRKSYYRTDRTVCEGVHATVDASKYNGKRVESKKKARWVEYVWVISCW